MKIKCRASPFSFFIAFDSELKMLITLSTKNAPDNGAFDFNAEREENVPFTPTPLFSGI
jgi:hypothetical protein